MKPVHVGDELTAIAAELHNGKSTGLYHVEIFNQKNHKVAQFKGLCYRTDQLLLDKNQVVSEGKSK
jgi:acyl-CoA thioesterase